MGLCWLLRNCKKQALWFELLGWNWLWCKLANLLGKTTTSLLHVG